MKKENETERKISELPACAAEYIKLVIKKMRYRRKVRADVMAELAAHFEDELRSCTTDEEKQQKARQLIETFGDVKLLGVLLRRAKKRCRPLWQKCLIQTSKVIGFVFLYVVVRVVFLTVGTANININYIDWLNKLVAIQVPEVENAKIDYDRAAELSQNIPPEIEKKVSVCTSKGRSINGWFADFNDYEIEHLVKWLTDSQKSFEALRQGAQKPYCWTIYRSDETKLIQGELLQNVMKPLSAYREVARAMRWQIVHEAYSGDVDAALSDCVVLQKFGMHLQGKGLLVEQMTGIGIEALAHQKTFMLLEKQDIPVDVLRDFYNKLESNLINEKPVIDLEAEKVFWYDLIQRGFTDDGKGNGRVLKNGFPLVIKDAPSSLAGFFFWNYPDRREVTATIDEYFKQAAELFEKTPWQVHTKGLSQKWDEIGKNIFMLKILGPAHSRIGEIIWRVKTSRAALLTVLAVLRYEKEKGKYPADLDELIKAGYLKQLPIDPFSNKTLVYKITDDGFTLYSLGADFDDDGGVRSKWGQGKEGGDQIFWPVQK